jgi:hypothetical protein
MKAKKTKRERSEQIRQVSAGLQDVLGMTQWRKEHPKATWGKPLSARGEQTRWIQTTGGEAVKLMRTHGTCLKSGGGFLPPG